MKPPVIDGRSLVYDTHELLSYLRITGEPDAETQALIARATEEIREAIQLTLLFSVLPLPETFSSKTLTMRLAGCDRAILFLVSIGGECDRIIRRAGKISAAYGAVTDAVASAFAEAAAESVEAALMHRYPRGLRRRISPGYGDFPLSAQKDVFRALSCEKHGICLLESMLTLPMKTVTAVIGIERGTNDE